MIGQWLRYDPATDRVITSFIGPGTVVLPIGGISIGGSTVRHAAAKQRPPRRAKRRARKKRSRR